MNIEIKEGIVTNDGEAIGTIEGSTCTLETKVAPVVKGAINAAFGSKLTFVVGGETEATGADEGSQSVNLGDLSDDALTAELKRRGISIGVDAGSSAPVVIRGIPLPPEQHPAMGDKDPAYVAWFREHHSEDEFNARYPASRSLPTAREFAKAEAKLRGKLQNEKTEKGE